MIWLRDALEVCGLLVVALGVGLVYAPAGVVALGAAILVVSLGTVGSRSGDEP